ncbi:MAG: acyltransferase family protein [Alphaproteobacteria bacterium]|nr:acyltransferase family protein [Alphaproteobacteria bacterium]
MEEKRKYHTLDGMRGVAALSVVPLHSPDYFGAFQNSSGYLAVDFFFLLSGFIIAGAYEERLRSGLSLSGFFKIRLVRFYPLYFLGLMLGLLAAVLGILRGTPVVPSDAMPVVVLLGLFMLPVPGLFGFLGYPLNGPAWTLFLEMAVNVLYAALLPLLKRGVLIGIVLLSAVGLAVAAFQFGTMHVGWKMDTVWAGLPRVCFSFFLGVLIWRAPAARLRLPVPAWFILVILGALLWVIPSDAVRPWYDLVCVLAVFPLLLMAGAALEPSTKTQQAYRFLGVTSYAVYAIHAPLYVLTHGVLKIAHVSLEHFIPLAIGFWAFLLIAAWAADLYYDIPLRRAAMERIRRTNVGMRAS